MDSQRRAPLPTEAETERDISSRVFADQIAPEERLTNIETASVVPQTS